MYTWFRVNRVKKACFDFVLISEELMPLVNKISIILDYKIDYFIVELELKLANFVKS